MGTTPELIIVLMGAGGGGLSLALVAARLLGPSGRQRRGPLLALAALLLVFTLDLADSALALASPARHGAFAGYVLLVWPLFPLAPWLYVRSATLAPSAGHWRSLRVPLTLWGVAILALVPLLRLDGAVRHAILVDGRLPAADGLLPAIAGLTLFVLGWLAALAVSAVATIRRLAAHRRRMRALLSNTSGVELRWLDGFLLFLLAAFAVELADSLLALFADRSLLGDDMAALVEVAILIGLALFGLQQGDPVPVWARDLLPPEAGDDAPLPAAGDAGAATIADAGAYARSGLDDDSCARILDRLDAVMAAERPWADPFLTLQALAERCGVKPHYLSQALNMRGGTSFYDYVNRWRVEAACRALAASEDNILAIAEQVGFNAKSTFNAAFRRVTGETPSAYRRQAGGRAA
ncbi:helix-turn-helix domain-containing protein [Sphingomonas changnyeongensis]|uniref:Helix-turn-helix domain-containing protein n=1 Tax=Sphingomonas changnyeongensis TaxID=2698679 RepID=A0A7Z2NTN9_9SPHN|nr:helix-turn-helix transcriptional regulator [Sphingomonas changnyeongensis]QHL89645.1 helix-turn-helix domain-containing protein [Sphingomonas changnyeongensis]